MLETKFNFQMPNSLEEAKSIQNALRQHIRLEDDLPPIKTVGGVDVGFEEGGEITRAAVAILSFPHLELKTQAIARKATEFPYIPGYLSFREIPAILEALDTLETLPDILLVDGQGIAHPRRMGIATHLGLVSDLPSIGVGKTRLYGRHLEVGENKGDWTPLTAPGRKHEVIGAVLRTRPFTKPLFISPGHRVSLETAIRLVLACCSKYKLPETTRWAHRLASDLPVVESSI